MSVLYNYFIYLIITALINHGCGQSVSGGKLTQIFSWKQIGFEINKVKYTNDSDTIRNPGSLIFNQELNDSEKFYIRYNNVPIGLEIFGNMVFVTVPRRRFGIPSTLNYVNLGSSSPLLLPYPNFEESQRIVSVYRPEVDACSRLWMVDTGLLEVPGARKQVQPPAILAYDLLKAKLAFRYELDPSVLINERTSGDDCNSEVQAKDQARTSAFCYKLNDEGKHRKETSMSEELNDMCPKFGRLTPVTLKPKYLSEIPIIYTFVTSSGKRRLTSITIDVDKANCGDAYAYVNDLATEGIIVFSLKAKKSWRINHPSFIHDEASLNFTVSGNLINWKDGIFSIALSPPDDANKRRAFYHPLASTQEFSVSTEILKNGGKNFNDDFMDEGTRGPNSQSGSHAIHSSTKVMFYANMAQDAILCWNIDMGLIPENVAIVGQDHEKFIYISDLVINGDDVWVLVNQMPKFVYSKFDVNADNFFIHRGKIQDLILGTACETFLV